MTSLTHDPVAGAAPNGPINWHWKRAPGRTEIVQCFNNHGIFLPIVPGVFSEALAWTVMAGTYESPEVSMLDGLIQPGEVILEIGAGCGYISSYCAKNPNTKAVYCVEANPNLIEVIKLTHEINAVDVTVYEEVLSKSEGQTNFYLNRHFWASGIHSSLGEQITVKTTSFQSRLDAIRPTMLVIDIEGGEETLFEGVNLTGVKKIMLELHHAIVGRRGIKKVFDLLSAQDFHYEQWHSSYGIVTFSHVDRI